MSVSEERVAAPVRARPATAKVEVLSQTRAWNGAATWWVWLLGACLVFALGSTARAQGGPPVVGISGPQGGPFPSSPVTVSLTNPHAAPIHWIAYQDEAWLDFSRNRGVLQPGASLPLTATVDPTVANQLATGVYESRVLYRHPTTQLRVTMVIFRLTVQSPTYTLSVTPGAGFNAQGPVGGPFTTTSQAYTVQNVGNMPFDWSVGSSASWVQPQWPVGGVLAPGASTVVVVQLDPTLTAALPAAVHSAAIQFRRTATSVVHQTRTVQLDVQAPNTGWTDFTPSADTRTVYVSTSGNDSNNGLSANSPKRTIAAGKALMRNGFPDWLLLKRGDVFDENIGHWITSGRSASEPQLISSYGTSTQRPLLRTGSTSGMTALHAGASGPTINHIAVVGIEMWAHTYNGSNNPHGITWMIDATGFTVEDCVIRGYTIDISFPAWGGRKRDIKLRRNVLADAFAVTGTVGHGLYMDICDNVLIEENVFDHNGWNSNVAGAVPSMFRHAVYIQSGAAACTGVVVRGNIFSNSASHGLHLRPGGVAENNLFLRNSIAMTLGGGHDPSVGGVNAIAKGNVILDGKNIDSANLRGWGIEMSNVASSVVSYNIIANQTLGGFPVPITMNPGNLAFGVKNSTLERNIISGWGGTIVIDGTGTQITGVMLRNNDFNQNVTSEHIIAHLNSANAGGFDSQTNRFRSLASANAWMRVGGTSTSLTGWGAIVGDSGSTVLPSSPYPDASRTIATYHQSIGGAASHDAFMAQARLQSRAYWRPQYTAAAAIAYIRAGFGMVVP
jgi:hypothetical protein